MKIRLHYGLAVAVFYTVFASATVGFVAFAMTQDVELVSRDYYARSLQHDQQAQARANAEALGDQLTVVLDAPRHRIDVRWPEVMAVHIRGTATLYRPSDASADRVEPIVATPDGRFSVPTAGLTPGLWRLQLQWRVGETAYYAERAFVLR
ncbi:MAG TPA: FixH family protein [Luteitalea sp.]|nr:FixH family protein [Luteitalea sp.]